MMKISHIISSIKQVGFGLLLLSSYSCVKEGPQGPQGPQGPAGESGTGEGGGSLRVVTYTLPATTDLQWRGGEYDGAYYYDLAQPSNTDSHLVILLPESLDTYIENGTMLVYMGAEGVWQQWPYSPVDFEGIKNFGYQLYKGNYGYEIQFFAAGRLTNRELEIFRREIRLVFVPITAVGSLAP